MKQPKAFCVRTRNFTDTLAMNTYMGYVAYMYVDLTFGSAVCEPTQHGRPHLVRHYSNPVYFIVYPSEKSEQIINYSILTANIQKFLFA